MRKIILRQTSKWDGFMCLDNQYQKSQLLLGLEHQATEKTRLLHPRNSYLLRLSQSVTNLQQFDPQEDLLNHLDKTFVTHLRKHPSSQSTSVFNELVFFSCRIFPSYLFIYFSGSIFAFIQFNSSSLYFFIDTFTSPIYSLCFSQSFLDLDFMTRG